MKLLNMSVTITKPLFIAEYAVYLQKPMDTTHYYFRTTAVVDASSNTIKFKLVEPKKFVRTGKKRLRIADQR